jgi:CrcB protein
MSVITNLVAVAAGGAVGAMGRHAIAAILRSATAWPAYAGTLVANVLGCFAIGVAYVVLEASAPPAWVKALLVTGLLGAFTTFSTFSLEAMHLVEDRKHGELAAYVVSSVVVGLVAVKVGMWLAERWVTV